MTTGRSTQYKNAMQDAIYGSGTPTILARLWLVAPALDGTGGTECGGNGYAAAALSNNAGNFPAAVAGVKSNAAAFQFPPATGTGWGAAVAISTHDNAGVMIDLVKFSDIGLPALLVAGGDAPLVVIGDLSSTIS